MKNNVNFERGLDPKESMNVGIFRGFEVKYEGVRPERILAEKKAAKDWEFNGKKVSYIEGKVRNGVEVYWIELSDKDNIQFQTFFISGNSFPEKADILISSLNNLDNGDVTDWFTQYVNKYDSHILAALKCYEDRITRRFDYDDEETEDEILEESINFERGKDPKISMNIGRKPLIRKWLDEMGLKECIINDDLTIDYPDHDPNDIRISEHMVNLKRKNLSNLPDYIQFNEVYGGFDISENHLTSLRGCPKVVKETKFYKGSFKCQNNELKSLEYTPTMVDGVYVCHGNPGKFTIGDVEKVCKVISGVIWADLVNESMGFNRNENPKKSMDIGNSRIIDWMKNHNIDEDLYRINHDGTITAFSDINLMGDLENPETVLTKFPDFIHFDTIMGSFYAANNNFSSLDGFPKIIEGDFSIYSEIHGVKKWKESDIRRRITVKGTIWN